MPLPWQRWIGGSTQTYDLSPYPLPNIDIISQKMTFVKRKITPQAKERRKQKRLWRICRHRFVPYFIFDLKLDGFWEVGEKCKRCGVELRKPELEEST